MPDQSYLDLKYFIDEYTYNCPFCNRRNVKYKNLGFNGFDWSENISCYIWRIRCSSCDKLSMHLTFEEIQNYHGPVIYFRSDIDIDSKIFYSVPTSFFIIDSRIPETFRDLLTEAEGCVKMNFLTGASACTRKAIYELTIREDAQGESYEKKIKFLKGKFKNIDSGLFDILCHIKDMTSDKIHEQSWDQWDSKYLKLFIETLKTILFEIYVLPNERKDRSSHIKDLLKKVKGKSSKEETTPESK